MIQYIEKRLKPLKNSGEQAQLCMCCFVVGVFLIGKEYFLIKFLGLVAGRLEKFTPIPSMYGIFTYIYRLP